MKTQITDFFSKLKPQQKGVVVMMGLGVILTVVGLLAYFSSSDKSGPQKPAQTKNAVVAMDNGLLGKSELLEAKKEAQVAKDALEERKRQEVSGMLPPPAGTTLPQPIQQPSAPQKKAPSIPPVPQQSAAVSVAPPPPLPAAAKASGVPPAPVQPTVIESKIGGILRVSGAERKSDNSDKKKAEKRTVFLPVSYMEATGLTGLDAPTSSDAKGNPVPMLIRVKTPAVLPNDVKANLSGCFVVADGKGNLATERAEMVLVRLSCVDRRGQAVINQDLTGIVIDDSDGKAGLRGKVVTKMGAMIARSMLGGFFGGVGEAIKGASTTSSFSALGSTSQIDPKDIAMAGVGSGMSVSFKEVQKFYMELAHQTLPVVEIGAARPMTLFVTKGEYLEIKNIKGGGR